MRRKELGMQQGYLPKSYKSSLDSGTCAGVDTILRRDRQTGTICITFLDDLTGAPSTDKGFYTITNIAQYENYLDAKNAIMRLPDNYVNREQLRFLEEVADINPITLTMFIPEVV